MAQDRTHMRTMLATYLIGAAALATLVSPYVVAAIRVAHTIGAA